MLRRHYDEERLDTDEFASRLDRVFAAATRQAMDEALAGLPLLPTGTPRKPSRRRHGEGTDAHPGWRPTTERFRDPSTGRIMRVWIDPATGGRHYLPDEA